jgi:hypothetical protein
MNWARIDCDIADHPKVEPLPETAQWAYVKVILWCRQHETRGVVPANIKFRRFTRHAVEKTRQRLIDAELLIEENGALIVPNFDRKQPTSDAEKLAKASAKKRRQRAQLSETTENVPGTCPQMSPGTVRNETGQDKTRQVPSSKHAARQSVQRPPRKRSAEEERLTDESDEIGTLGLADFQAAVPASRAAAREEEELAYLEQQAAGLVDDGRPDYEEQGRTVDGGMYGPGAPS